MFERDSDAISKAGDKRATQIEPYRSGEQATAAQKILNEISVAKDCLVNAEKRAVYDRQLRRQLVDGLGQNAGGWFSLKTVVSLAAGLLVLVLVIVGVSRSQPDNNQLASNSSPKEVTEPAKQKGSRAEPITVQPTKPEPAKAEHAFNL